MEEVSVEGRVGTSHASKSKFSSLPGSTFGCNKNTSHFFSSTALLDPVAVEEVGEGTG